MGAFLREMPKNKGAEGTGSNQHEVRSRETTAPKTLRDLGISKKESAPAENRGFFVSVNFTPEFTVLAKKHRNSQQFGAIGSNRQLDLTRFCVVR